MSEKDVDDSIEEEPREDEPLGIADEKQIGAEETIASTSEKLPPFDRITGVSAPRSSHKAVAVAKCKFHALVDSFKMRRSTKVFLGSFVVVQAVIIALRMMLTGHRYAQVRRVHEIVTLEFGMLLFSILLWRRFTSLFNAIFGKPKIRLLAPRDFAKALLLLFLIFTHLCWAMFFVLVGDDPSWLAIISFVSVAVYIHTVIFMLIAIIIERLAALLRIGHDSTGTRRWLVDKNFHSAFALGLALLLCGSGVFVTWNPPIVRDVSVPLKNLPSEFEGFRIALLTDLHIGPTVGRWRVKRIVDAVNKLQPDVVTIAGDLVDGTVRTLKGAAAPLSGLNSTFGTFFSTGNHEYYHGNIDLWFSYLEEIGVHPLHNQHKKLYPLSASKRYLCLAGVDDIFAERAHIVGHGMDIVKALTGCANNETVVVLSHQPNGARRILDGPLGPMVDLVLSGHTHGGQMYVLWPFAYLTNAYLHGLYVHSLSGAHIYVSAGTNFWGPPVKMFGLCEITLLELRRA